MLGSAMREREKKGGTRRADDWGKPLKKFQDAALSLFLAPFGAPETFLWSHKDTRQRVLKVCVAASRKLSSSKCLKSVPLRMAVSKSWKVT